MSSLGIEPTLRYGARRGLIAVLAAAMLTAGCSSVVIERFGLSDISAQRDDIAADLPPAQRREHERLVSAYGGVYRAPKFEALINQTVERLVAASERPDLKYRVVILNSPAINEQFGAQGLQPIPTTPEAFAKRLREEIRKWGPVVKASGAKPE